MTLLIIILVLIVIITIGGTIIADYDRVVTFFMSFFLSGVVGGIIFMVINVVGYNATKKVDLTTYSIPLASLNDGTGVEVQFRGGLFLRRGYIQDTQHYSYYQKNENGSYNLQKRPADASTIWQDVAPENARVDITDKVTTCVPSWYVICSDKPIVEFSSANFHVPEGSIGEEYELDAQ